MGIFILKSIRTTLCELVVVLVIEFLECALVKRVADLLHKVVIEIKVMQNSKAHTEHLLSLEKVADICTGVALTSRTATCGRNRT